MRSGPKGENGKPGLKGMLINIKRNFKDKFLSSFNKNLVVSLNK